MGLANLGQRDGKHRSQTAALAAAAAPKRRAAEARKPAEKRRGWALSAEPQVRPVEPPAPQGWKPGGAVGKPAARAGAARLGRRGNQRRNRRWGAAHIDSDFAEPRGRRRQIGQRDRHSADEMVQIDGIPPPTETKSAQ